MSMNTGKTTEAEKPSVADRVVDAARHAVHVSHEAHAVKSLAEDEIEDGVRATRRAVRRATERLENIKDEGIHYVKRQPLKTVAMVAGVGFMVGLAAGWVAARFSSVIPERPIPKPASLIRPIYSSYVLRDIETTMYPSRLCRVINGQFRARCAITSRRINKHRSITRHSFSLYLEIIQEQLADE